jgi:hypothetical protein
MSTIKSSTEHLTLNADGSGKDIKFQANGVEKASISSAGAFTSTSIDATKLSGDLPAIDGSALTGVGKVLQVVNAVNGTPVTLSGTLGVYSSGVSATITPSSTSSKIIVIAVLQYHLSSGNHPAIASKILRGSTNIHTVAFNGYYGAETFNRIQNSTVTVLDSPSTTSAVTYDLQGANTAGSTNSGTYVGKLNQYNDSSIMLIEIKG